ncbi:MAG: hypothetical protein HY314_09085 [Acidobacteria bacterium]|nr:hypothetical protein [Acidobacteriota bacterium]
MVKGTFISGRIEPLEEGGCLATSDELPGLVAQGRTVAKAQEAASVCVRRTGRQDVARKPHITPSPTDGNKGLEGRIAYA